MAPRISGRPWSQLSDDEQNYILDGPGTIADRCRAIGASYDSCRNARGRRGRGDVARSAVQYRVQVAPTRIYDDPLCITGDALILADPHVPFHDADLCNRAIELAARWNVQQCVIAGDLVDLTALSPFEPDVPVLPVEEELAAAEEFAGALANVFERVYWIKGNHDVRLYKRLLKASVAGDRADRLIQLAENVTSTQYHWCIVESAGRIWQIEHPLSYSQMPGAVGNDLAARFLRNIVVAHSHAVGLRRDRSGRYTIIDSGGVFRPAKLAYINLVHRRNPAVNQGFVIIRNGVGYLFDPENVDWPAWGI